MNINRPSSALASSFSKTTTSDRMLSLIALRKSFFAGGLCLIIAGCGESPGIRNYVVDSENRNDLTSEMLRREFPPIPFRWAVPESWSVAANDQFSLRAWRVEATIATARITLGQFPVSSGIPAQVQRWRRQLELEAVSDDDAMKHVKALKTVNHAGSFATIKGRNETILAFILPIQSQFWILRFKSDNTIAEDEGEFFRGFCRSLEYVEPPEMRSQANHSLNPSLPRLRSQSTSTGESGVGASASRPAPVPSQSSKSDSVGSAAEASPIKLSKNAESGGDKPPSADESSAEGD